MKRKLLNILVLLLLCLGNPLYAQKYLSPYSQFGIGDMVSNQYVRNRGVGTSLAFGGVNRMNLSNPASWGQITSYNLETGISTNFYSLKSTTASYRNVDFWPAYISIAVPLNRDTQNIWRDSVTRHNAGLSFGLAPYSRVGFQTRSVHNNPSDIAYKAQEYNSGSGGLSRLYVGFGAELFNNFYFGANANYIFGRNAYEHRIEFPVDSNFYSLRETNSYVAGGWTADIGLLSAMHVGKNQPDHKLYRNDTLRIGLTFSPALSLNVRQDLEAITTYNGFVTDSLTDIESGKGKIKLPMSLGLGFAYTINNCVTLAADMNYTKWSDYSLMGKTPTQPLNDQWIVKLGSEWRFVDSADIAAGTETFFALTNFRAGVKYGMMQYPGTQVSQMGGSIGIGIPLRKKGVKTYQLSYLDLSLEGGRIGNASKNIVQQDYLMVSMGLHLFDFGWFNRRKIE
jgi:hypothetical protein